MDLKKYFITTSKQFKEGDVSVFAQTIKQKSIVSAELWITALGLYHAEINGVKVGDKLFSPGYTYYPRHLYYQKYDVTKLLTKQENLLKVYVGQGWYCGRFTHENKLQIYGDNIAVSWALKLIDKDGKTVIFNSSENVDELSSPYQYAGFYDGEIYDATITEEKIGSATKYDGKLPDRLEETTISVKLQEEMPILSVTENAGNTIIDYGQNFAGIVTINSQLMDNEYITVRHGELLNKDGSLYTKNLRKAKATLTFRKPADQDMIFIPRFTYMGFRYVEISGVSYSSGLIKAYAIHSEMDRTGYFKSENPDIQRLYDNQVWSQKSNYIEIPTDCPQRDERMGYTGDGQVFALTGSYNFDSRSFWHKYLRDIRYSQMDNTEGYVAPTIPALGPAGIGYMNMLGWGNAVTIIPEILYEQYGDLSYLKEQYDSIKKFVDTEIRHFNENNLWMGINLGDWLAPGKDMGWGAMHNNPISNSFIVNDLRILSWLSKEIGSVEEQQNYSGQYAMTKDAYIKEFIDANGGMPDDHQGAYVMALQYVVTDGELRSKLLAKLVDNVRQNGLQTGFFSTAFLLPLLVEAQESQLAYDLLFNEAYPGWLYQVKKGATSTWERWDAILPDGSINDAQVTSDNMVSFNHYAFGSIGGFFYQYILGIKPLDPGYQRIQIKPYPDHRFGKVEGSYLSINGKIDVKWNLDHDVFSLDVVTPAPTRIILPDGQCTEVNKGKHSMTCVINKN